MSRRKLTLWVSPVIKKRWIGNYQVDVPNHMM
jgi:hypothetical protein